MCGITGLVGDLARRDGDCAVITQMLLALAHRGPDDSDLVQLDGAILGHRRLSIIDLAGGRQPISNETGDLWLVCNGEIYNYRALRQELVDKGHHFKTQSDSEVLLHLYEEEGRELVHRLRGMFAFALYDRRHRVFFAARDHLGQKPFYYTHQGDGLAFASEIKGLLPLFNNKREIDERALLQYLSLRIIASPLSMFKNIAKLPPGHTLYMEPGRPLEIRSYWQPVYEPKHDRSEQQLLEELEARFIEAVDLHMVSDVKLGAFLSGGLDSTMVAAVAAQYGSRQRLDSTPLPTFTIGIPYRDVNEAPAAREVADLYQTDHLEHEAIPSLTQSLPDLLFYLDEPSDPLAACSLMISRIASEKVKVVLGGDGGDELFGGYDRYYGHLYASYYAMIPQHLRQGLIGPLLGMIPDGSWYKSKAHQLKWLHQASLMQGADRHAHNLSYFYFGEAWYQKLLGPQLSAALKDFDPLDVIRDAYNHAQASHPVDRMLSADARIRLPDHSVMILDRTSMAFGLEARSPFMDHKMAEFCASLPTRLKIRMRQLRYLQKKLATRYLPPSVLNRKKQGFASALPYLLRHEYQHLFDVFLTRSHLADAGYLRFDAIQALLKEHQEGKADHSQRLWLILHAEAWFRMFISGETREGLHDLIAGKTKPHHGIMATAS